MSSIANGDSNGLALSYSGCGFLGTYHLGSALCMTKHGSLTLNKASKVAGASAGGLVAAIIVLCPHRLKDCLNRLYELADEVNGLKFGALTPGFSLVHRLETLISDELPKDNCNEMATGRLYLSMTRVVDKTNRLESSFCSRDYLIKQYVDGGLSNNLPKFSDLRTITISPFSGEAEISPDDKEQTKPIFDWTMTLANQVMKVNLKNLVRGAQALFPPRRPVLEYYYQLGYRDTMRFLLKEGLFEREEGSEV